MDDTDSEMNAALDALEAEHDPIESKPDQEVLESDEIVGDRVIEKEKPKGYLSYEQWIDAGKDPDDFKGINAYSSTYDRIQEIRELKDSMKHVVDGVDQWKNQQADHMKDQVAQAKLDAKAEFDEAHQAGEMDAALAAQEKLNNLNRQEVVQAPRIDPAIGEFFQKNPILDQNSPSFNADFFEDMKMIQHTHLNKLTGGDPELANKLTPNQIERSLKLAFNTAKEMHPEKFKSSRNTRRTTPSSQPRQGKTKAGDYSTRLKSVQGNSRNVRDTSSANDIYEYIKAADPKAAETFAKNVLGE